MEDNKNKEMQFCQSCGMPLTDEILGTNADGSKNHDYCIYCFKDGAFTGNFTMEEMAEFCAQFVDEFNKNTGQHLTEAGRGLFRCRKIILCYCVYAPDGRE